MRRRNFLCTTLAATASIALSDKKPAQPNIVFIMSDDHAAQAVSCYGSWLAGIAPTPNIDRIAREGSRFDHVFCTNAICGPSRAAILTGKFSHVNGFYKNEGGGDFDGSQQTFPKLLQQAGYQTAVIGKWHLGTAPTGFDYSKVLINGNGQGTYWNPEFQINGKERIKETKFHSTRQIANDALEWLEHDRDKTKPFMLMYQFKAPHRNWDPDPAYKNLFADMDIPEPETFNDDYDGRKAAADQWQSIEHNLNPLDLKQTPPEGLQGEELRAWLHQGNKNEFWTPDPELKGQELKKWKYQRYIKDYLRCVRGVDDAVGRMLDYLDKSGLADNTLVIYTSDQGFYLGEHGWFDKRFMYEESFRMPFLMRWPGKIKPGSTNSDLLMNIDFAPTLLEAAGAPIPSDMQGKSFAGGSPGRDSVYYHYYEFPFWHHVQPHYGVRTDRYKLIHFYYSMDEWELFDLKKDPNELKNLINDPEYADVARKMKAELSKQQTYYGDTMSHEEMRAMTDARIERIYK
jgi:arylsulfatase A-like enzyme